MYLNEKFETFLDRLFLPENGTQIIGRTVVLHFRLLNMALTRLLTIDSFLCLECLIIYLLNWKPIGNLTSCNPSRGKSRVITVGNCNLFDWKWQVGILATISRFISTQQRFAVFTSALVCRLTFFFVWLCFIDWKGLSITFRIYGIVNAALNRKLNFSQKGIKIMKNGSCERKLWSF